MARGQALAGIQGGFGSEKKKGGQRGEVNLRGHRTYQTTERGEKKKGQWGGISSQTHWSKNRENHQKGISLIGKKEHVSTSTGKDRGGEYKRGRETYANRSGSRRQGK